jgi:hypothetical protein
MKRFIFILFGFLATIGLNSVFSDIDPDVGFNEIKQIQIADQFVGHDLYDYDTNFHFDLHFGQSIEILDVGKNEFSTSKNYFSETKQKTIFHKARDSLSCNQLV